MTKYTCPMHPEIITNGPGSCPICGMSLEPMRNGVNDAPALTLAYVGIAMGNGVDIAIDSADVTLIKGNLQRIEKAIDLSQKVMRNIRQNLFFAFAFNVIGNALRLRKEK